MKTLTAFLLFLALAALLSPQVAACCEIIPEPTITPQLGPAPCHSDTPHFCYRHQTYMPIVYGIAMEPTQPPPVVVTPTPTFTATAQPAVTATPTMAPPTLIIVTPEGL